MSQVINKTNTAFISAAELVTGNDENGSPVTRDMASTEYTYINQLQKAAYDSIITDLSAPGGNAAELATWEFDVTDNVSNTHIAQMFPAGVANKIITSPHPNTCIVIFPIDDRIKEYFSWVEVNGSPRDSMMLILDAKCYVVPDTKTSIVLEAAATYAAHDNRTSLYESEGSCSLGSYTTSASCIANNGTWSSSVDEEEIADIFAKYSALINQI